MVRTFLIVAAISGFLAVVFGAFGSHGLQGNIAERLFSAYKTGVDYQFYHTLALLCVALLLLWKPLPQLQWAGYFFIAGIVLFSGSLYLMALGGPKWLGPITPVGGVCFMLGWLSVLLGISKADY